MYMYQILSIILKPQHWLVQVFLFPDTKSPSGALRLLENKG